MRVAVFCLYRSVSVINGYSKNLEDLAKQTKSSENYSFLVKGINKRF